MINKYRKYIYLTIALIILAQGFLLLNVEEASSQDYIRESLNYITGDIQVSSRTVSGSHQGCSDTGVTCHDGDCSGKWRGWSCSTGSGVWCVNHPQGMQGHLYYSYTVHDCRYVAEVLAWSQCVAHSFDSLNGTEYATDVRYATVGGSSCSSVPTTRPCTMEPTPGRCGTSDGYFSPEPPRGVQQCRAGEPMEITENEDGTYSWWCNGSWGSNVNVQCNTVPNPAIDGNVSCYIIPEQRYYDGSEGRVDFNAVISFTPAPNYPTVQYLWGGNLVSGGGPSKFVSDVNSLADNNYLVWVKASYYGVEHYAYCGIERSSDLCDPEDPECEVSGGFTVSRIPLIDFDIPIRVADDDGFCVAEWSVEYSGSGTQAPVVCRITNEFDQVEIDLGEMSTTSSDEENVRAGNSYKLACESTITGIVVDTEIPLICVDPNITER